MGSFTRPLTPRVTCHDAAYTPTSAVTAPWNLDAWITCTAYLTSTMTLQVNGTVEYESVATGVRVQAA